MSAGEGRGQQVVRLSTVLFLASMLILPQSYVLVKLACLGGFLVAHGYAVFTRQSIAVYQRHLVFYYLLAIVGIVWALVGMAHRNDMSGIIANLRLYGLWSIAYLLIVTLMRNYDEMGTIHDAIVWAGIVICVMTIVGLADVYFQWGIVGEAMRKELGLYVGFGDGYIRIHSNAIASLFFVAPYLIATRLRLGPPQTRSRIAMLSLLLCVIVVAISGRRALWLSVACTPVIVVGLASVTGTRQQLTRAGSALLFAYIVAVPVLGVAVAASIKSSQGGVIEYFQSAFSAEDERTIQKSYLIDAFEEKPLLGAGFGAKAGYSRSEELPWLYELSYYQLLFNVGIVGVLCMLGGLICYTLMAMDVIRRFSVDSPIPFGIVIGFYSLLIGAYSNPYFQYFDSLIFVALLVYVSTVSATAKRYTLK